MEDWIIGLIFRSNQKNMKLIKLTNLNDGIPIYVNIDQIGYIYQVPAKMNYGREEEPAYTKVSVTTHNNGGLKVAEDIEQILRMINYKSKVGSLK